MYLPDINLLVYHHRSESPQHTVAAKALNEIAFSPEPLALCSQVISGFIRIVTNHRIFKDPTPSKLAQDYIDYWFNHKGTMLFEAKETFWETFKRCLNQGHAHGNLVSDAYLASICIENGLTLLSFDRDFSRFPELKLKLLS